MTGLFARKAELLEAHRIRWELGFNDPTLLGWLTVAGYLAAALCAWQAAAAARRAGVGFDRRFWLACCAAMAVLAVNKQLDFHTLITDLARYLAVQHDLYQQRRAYQKAFIAAVALGAGVAGAALWLAMRRRDGSLRLALAGLALCGLYVLVRAASFHHADALLRTTVLGVRWDRGVELAGLAVVAIAAWRYRPSAIR